MPLTTSLSSPIVCDSSTVITPSLPTSFITSAINLPTFSSPAEMVATCAISSLVVTGLDIALSMLTTSFTRFSMVWRIATGLPPAAICLKPSVTSACVKRVAVVVPSPATSFVLLATSCTKEAPAFSNLSSSSISLAIVTPSLVIVGEPNPLSSTTCRPAGPSVILTALATLSTPFLMAARAASSNNNCFAILFFLSYSLKLLFNDRYDVRFIQNQHFLVVNLNFIGAVF